MKLNSPDYFAYKKNKMQAEMNRVKTEKPISKFNFLLQLFLATFIVMFIIIVIAIMKYSSKMDIEYTKGELSYNNSEISPKNMSSYNNDNDDEQGKIDKRLMLIQQEENAPSEAKIIAKEKKSPEVIDPSHIEANKKIEKIEKIKAKNAQNEAESNKKNNILEEIKQKSSHLEVNLKNNQSFEDNVIISSKVLIGRFSTFDEAKAMQNEIKQKDSSLSPYVRKVGDIFSVQMGSYKDFHAAKVQAQVLKSKGFDVWIYQQ